MSHSIQNWVKHSNVRGRRGTRIDFVVPCCIYSTKSTDRPWTTSVGWCCSRIQDVIPYTDRRKVCSELTKTWCVSHASSWWRNRSYWCLLPPTGHIFHRRRRAMTTRFFASLSIISCILVVVGSWLSAIERIIIEEEVIHARIVTRERKQACIWPWQRSLVRGSSWWLNNERRRWIIIKLLRGASISRKMNCSPACKLN